MLRWALIFLIGALAAAILGFVALAGAAAAVAQGIFFILLVLCVVGALMAIAQKRSTVPTAGRT